jgi:hypothetical protein
LVSAIPWEEGEDYIRSGHRSPDDFQEDSFRTITIDAEKGIKAVIGKPKGKDTTEVQSYLFDKSKDWTVEKAKAWFEKHKGEALHSHGLLFDVKFLTEKADPNARIFPWSMLARYYAKPGRMIIYGTALVAGETRKGDVFNCEELRRGARSLIGGPIEVFEHTWDVGESRWLPFPDNAVLDGEEVDGRLEYIAGVGESRVQQLIREGVINQVSVNAICRHVPADDPGQCNGMILNGFCLLHKDSVAASPGTNVKVWNCLRANARRLEGDKPPESEVKNMNQNKNEGSTSQAPSQKTETDQLKCPKCSTVFAYYQWQQENWHCPNPDCRVEVLPPEPIVLQLRGQKTAQISGHGPVAGVPEPSIEDRVKTLELDLKSFQERVYNEFTAVNAKLDTLIQTMPKGGAIVAAPATASVPKTAAEWDTEYINDLPDSAFAVIGSGGEKDDQGKTVPRTLRHLPHHKADGSLDLPHLRNALARMNQIEPASLQSEAKNHLCAHAKESDIVSEFCGEQQPKTEQVPCGCQKTGIVAAVKPVEPQEHLVVLTEAEILGVLTDKRRFTSALQLNGILDLLEAKKKEAAKDD